MWFRSSLIITLVVSYSVFAKEIVLDRLEAFVNSDVILLSDLVEFKKTSKLRIQLDPLFATTQLSKKTQSASDNEISDFLLEESLIKQIFPIQDAAVEQEINTIQTNNRFDRKMLTSALAEQGFKFDQYFELIRASLSKRTLIDRDIRTRVFISDDDVKNHFYNQSDRQTTSRSYKIKAITINPENYKTPSDAYDVAKRAIEAIQAGESFDEIAKRYDDSTNSNDLGFLSEDDLSPEVAAQVKKMKVGETSPILGSGKTAYMVVKLLDLKTGQEDRLEKVREEIRNQLTTEEYQRQISLWIDREKQKAVVHIAGQPAIPKQYEKKQD